MLNIQKYENEILSEYRDISCDYMTDCGVYELLYSVASKHNKEVDNNWGLKSLLDWFLQEYKDPILDDKEKEYLSAVIKPFKDNIKNIIIIPCSNSNLCFISIRIENNIGGITLPYFEKGKMYKGMKLEKEYTLEELGL